MSAARHSWPQPTTHHDRHGAEQHHARLDPPAEAATVGPSAGSRIELVGAGASAGGTTLLDGVDLVLEPGELVAIVGASGAGKSTLLDVLSGVRPIDAGTARVDGVDLAALAPADRGVALVPQDDVMPGGITLRRVLHHAARLRLPRGTGPADVDAAVDDALAAVGLDDRADTVVARLSGGQRRRASIAMELVTHPRACLLDEPTSGLDPLTADGVVARLRALADAGSTVAFTTHHADDLARCDRVVALGSGGRVLFDGTIDEGLRATGCDAPDRLHRAVTTLPAPVVAPSAARRRDAGVPSVRPDGAARHDRPARAIQWWTLTVRTTETMWRNRLTTAIMLGSPAMVIAMFAVLFRPGVFDPADPSPTAAVMVAFWVAFGGFFFGLTYGLLQICPEGELIRREHRAGVPAGVQVLAKLAALTPVLIAIDVAMLAVLRLLDRLPALDPSAMVRLGVTLALDGVAALALGLLASAAVSTPAQASLALPMLCFPAVLFSGAVLPVPVMAGAGRWLSSLMPDRWAFEGIGAELGLRRLFAGDPSGVGPALLDEFGPTWTGSLAAHWLRLVGFTLVLAVAAVVVLDRRCRSGARRATA